MTGSGALSRPALRRSLQLVAALMLAVVMVMTGLGLLRLRDALLVDRISYLERLALAFTDQATQALGAVDVIMRDSAALLGQAESGAAGAQLLRRRLAGVPQLLDLAVFDAQGRAIADSRQTSVPDPVGDDPVREGGAIGAPFQLLDGRWTAPMRRRIEGADGTAGHVVAWLDLATLGGLFRAADLEDGGAVLLLRADGLQLAATPPLAAPGTVETALSAHLRAALRSGGLVSERGGDGAGHLVAVKALHGYPLAVEARLGDGVALEVWRRTGIMALLVAATTAVVVGAMLLVLSQRAGDFERLVAGYRAAKDAAEASAERLRGEIEERSRTEAMLRETQRIEVMGQLTGAVAHDFNNLLTVLLGNLDLMDMEAGLPPRLGERISAMRGAAERGEQLTGQLLAFSRRQKLKPERVELGTLVTGLADLLRSAAGSKIRVELEIGKDLPAAMVDPHQVELVLMNLVINARDAMPDGGTLTITTAIAWLGPNAAPDAPPPGDYVVLRVRDTGEGMSPEVQARAMEPFFTTKATGSGAGLGLSQVYGVARQSGGGVRLDSMPGRGTTVWVYLPVASAQAAAETAMRRAPAPREEGVRVLLVDDDDAVRVTTALILRDLGFEVTEASNSMSALGLLDGGAEVDVLVSDIAMPGMAGAELAARADIIRPGLPIVFLSGHADPNLLRDAEGAPRRLVRKPFRPAELAAEIAAAMH